MKRIKLRSSKTFYSEGFSIFKSIYLRVELRSEAVSVGLELLAFDVILPSSSEDVFDALHVRSQLPINLLGPDNGTSNWWNVANTGHSISLAVDVLDLELLVQSFDIVFDPLNQLGLIFPDGAPDVRPHEEGVEPGENAEHLIGILGRSEL